jgi:hypothetical protein
MPPPKRGHFVLHSNVLPPVTAGKYELRSDQTGTPFDVQEERTHVTVSSPRYTMPTDQILSTFPPANAEGAFGDRLPQIVLKRRTLPWERNPAEVAAVSSTPWLALVVVAEGEAEVSTPVPVEQCVTPGVSLLDPADRDVPEGVYLAVTQTVLNKIFPTAEDLPLCTHVREVDVQDTELAAGDDDGWAAVVLANRLPVFDTAGNKPVRYLACLVNIEGQLASLPPPVPPVNIFEFELAQDWSVVTTTQAVQQADSFVTGVGQGFELPQAQLDAPPDRPGLAALPPGGVSASARLPAIGADLDGTAAAGSAAASNWAQRPTEAVAEAAFATDAARVVRDTMTIGWRYPIELFAVEKVYRFPVLAYWSFTTNEGATFETLMQDLDVGLVGSVPPPVPPQPEGPTVVETGHIELEHQTRRGDATHAWYRGPLVPHPTDRTQPDSDGRLPVAHSADQLRRVVPDGREDLSFAAAYEIGRLLALSQLSIVSALLRFRREQFGAARVKHLIETIIPGALLPELDDLFDLSHLVATGLLEKVATRPAAVAGPPRPVADPGRPLELSGSLDTVVAQGLGLDLQAIREAADTVGIVAALGSTDVPLVTFGAGPLTKGPQLDAMRTALRTEVERLAGLAAPQTGDLGAAPRGARAAPAEPPHDALDDLIDRIPDIEETD